MNLFCGLAFSALNCRRLDCDRAWRDSEIQEDETGDGDGDAETGEKTDGFVREDSPEDTPDGKQVGYRGGMSG